MNIIKTIADIKQALSKLRNEGKSIGFVPTMGALHHGHLSLIQQSKAENDITVCSIFVNPIQFNNKKDLEKYPNQITDDIQMLTDEGCDFLFKPGVEDSSN